MSANTEHETLYEQQGLKIWRNANNRFVICRLHYSADPAKRSPEWKREAASGMTPEKFAREFEIDWTAVMGAKVFPEATNRKPDIVIPLPYPDFGPDVRYWGGLDYGQRNPSSFHVYTLVDGCIYSVWELYEPAKDGVQRFADKMKAFPYWDRIKYIACDPDCWSLKVPEMGALTSVQELFWRAGVRNLIKGLRDEEAWIATMRQHWLEPDPTFKIFSCCVNQIREFETCIYINQSERQLQTQVYKEQIADKDNHSLDDCKYFMNSRPAAQARGGYVYGNMANRWAVTKARTQPPAPPSPVKGYH